MAKSRSKKRKPTSGSPVRSPNASLEPGTERQDTLVGVDAIDDDTEMFHATHVNSLSGARSQSIDDNPSAARTHKRVSSEVRVAKKRRSKELPVPKNNAEHKPLATKPSENKRVPSKPHRERSRHTRLNADPPAAVLPERESKIREIAEQKTRRRKSGSQKSPATDRDAISKHESNVKGSANPSRPPVSPNPVTLGPEPGPLDALALQIEDQLRSGRLLWGMMSGGDRLVVLAALSMLVGVLLPWLSVSGQPFQIGLTVGGQFQGAIALVALWLGTRRHRSDPYGIHRTGGKKEIADRSDAFWIVVLGVVSTFFGMYLFMMWGLQKSAAYPLHIHWGVYWTLVSGTGLSYGGFTRFFPKRD